MIRNPKLSDILAHGALHDLHKTFLGVMGMLEQLRSRLEKGSDKNIITIMEIKQELYELRPDLNRIRSKIRNLEELVMKPRLYQMGIFDLEKLLKEALGICEQLYRDKVIKCQLVYSGNITVECDGGAIMEVLTAIFMLIVRCIKSHEEIEVEIVSIEKQIQIKFKNRIHRIEISEWSISYKMWEAYEIIKEHQGDLIMKLSDNEFSIQIVLPYTQIKLNEE